MKNYVFSISLLMVFAIITLDLAAQNITEDNFPTEDGKIVYKGVVTVDSTISDVDLYLNAKEWVIDNFKSIDNVIVSEDKESNILIAKGFIVKGHNSAVKDAKNWFTLKIEMKDGRYRYTMYDIIYELDIYYEGKNLGWSTPLYEWFDITESVKGEKAKERLISKLNIYAKELDAEFKAALVSLEKGMGRVRDDEW